jgi:hypothetical protein
VCTAALLVFFIAVRQGAEAGCGGFQASCQDLSIGGDGVLSAQCKADGGNLLGTSINLDNYVGNSDGVLVPNNGGFSRSCQSIGLADQGDIYLTASCKQDNGALISTSLDISTYVENNNGGLNWNPC